MAHKQMKRAGMPGKNRGPSKALPLRHSYSGRRQHRCSTPATRGRCLPTLASFGAQALKQQLASTRYCQKNSKRQA